MCIFCYGVFMFNLSIFRNFYGRSPKWRTVRNLHIKNNPECMACGKKDGLEAHHIIPYNVDSSKELDSTNLITLCDKNCHFVFGHLYDWKSWNINVVSDCSEYRNKIKNRPYLHKLHNISNVMGAHNEKFNSRYLNYLWKLLFFWHY